ncbi:MAG TPA: hypothetical protein VIW27_03620 [Gammaproteobacteria bacterium]
MLGDLNFGSGIVQIAEIPGDSQQFQDRMRFAADDDRLLRFHVALVESPLRSVLQ